ncbi:formate dehydrogenase subunit alpha [Magnetospira sp. QH-2]|uniref:formate dehydrogenase subunit alpha n=1 Tax=Magnetospira sp. (strain QH-2) TaxID=1288970 RepID=UPI0003E81919|nr:formate dehydrogenase subunit alpha [Magnetospira sp. QH-2]CCQ72462.1 Putative formate dehydrogenase, alpha subunit.FdsA [Magnetospira sp. QH-2]
MTVHIQKDFGTPAQARDASVTVQIDGQPVTVTEGTSILRAAAEAGIHIPRLCATDKLTAYGSCRLCLVEIEGRNGTPSSCTTPVVEGMRVRTQSHRLRTLRRSVMELYISDHPLDCLTCAANGDCDLQDMAAAVGLRDVRYGEGRTHRDNAADTSNPYFTFDPSKCIVCSLCVRVCEEVQGSFALTVLGRGFDSRVAAAGGVDFLGSECVSCGACVQACPTATLSEKNLSTLGLPDRAVSTTCAYCGVGCSLRAEVIGEDVVRMVPETSGGANEGHACVKGRFAWSYATHEDRITRPMIREKAADSWREVDWPEAIEYAAQRLNAVKAEQGPQALGGLTSSRCTNEEVFLVQKMIRTAFGTNNVDTCARVCHAPTGYGLKQAFGTSAGTQDFKSVDSCDVAMVIGANPTEGHPVFASRLKRRLRRGAKLIVIDPRRIDLVESPHVRADHHLALQPGTNVAVVNALAHVVMTENLADRTFIAQRCDPVSFAAWESFISGPENAPEALEQTTGVPATEIRAAARLYATGGNGAIYYGLGVTEHSQGTTTVLAMANLAMATGNIGRNGVGVNPLRGQNNVQGSCDMGSFPHEFSGYRSVADDAVRATFEAVWKKPLSDQPGYRIPNMLDAAVDGRFKAMFIQGEDIAQSDPNTQHVEAALRSLDLLIVQDLFLNETANHAHVFLPGTSFLEKDGTFTNAERRINRVRPVMPPRSGKHEWQVLCDLATALGQPMAYDTSAAIMDEIARLTPTFAGVSFEKLDQRGSLQWPCTDDSPEGTPIMHQDRFVNGAGYFELTEFVPTRERTSRKFPLILTTGRVLSQYNVGAQTRRTANVAWHAEDVLEIHPHDAEQRGIGDGAWVAVSSRMGAITLRAVISERMTPGVVYTTFHHPVTGANVITTDQSDWATNCPEYKVTAVQVRHSNGLTDWQARQQTFRAERRRIADSGAP